MPLGAPSSVEPHLPGPRDSFSSLSPGAQALCLAPERAEFLAMVLPQSVVSSLPGAQAPSTRTAYSYRWGVFQSWYDLRQVDLLSCRPHGILQFLQGMLEEGKSPSTLRGMVAALVGPWKLAEGRCHCITQFLKGALRVTPYHRRPAVSPWDVEVVLSALQHEPFKPLETVGLKWLSLKSAFLLAIVLAKRMEELRGLSVHEECCYFLPYDVGVMLRSNSTLRSCQSPTPAKLLSCTLSTLLRTVKQG